ncbi:alpha-1,3-mannosyl-glycoprotein 4-beta-N-acetylglucosaminyltransferase C-like [Gigantopelta aegis]|uniref:alpha-1,3-mannosyl-glycoprotein 4-beta-N-acetylglucosaminyltransferase C-like n=1 Tax=Gigantopelta aegis TaxID=1735272 RepID=UPI001B88C1E5|nr:alpha-1,3-mannosyl-glycoprotein 4-beta-N-acetylglucosaminyltransferase C-like [Gigantopelta aegis]
MALTKILCSKYFHIVSDTRPATDGVTRSRTKVDMKGTLGVILPRATLLAGIQRSHQVSLTVGIPTVKREGVLYLLDTVQSLVNESSPQDRRSITVVVMLADVDQSHNEMILSRIRTRFPAELKSGFLQIIRAPLEDYPSLQNLRRTFGDAKTRVVWRSKQNLDYSSLMAFSQNISQYYLQLEDDVIAAPSYYRKIMSFIKSKRQEWTMMEFSALGFIAKLYQSRDLMKLAILLRTYFNEQPCDFLLEYHLRLELQKERYIRKPTLFKHMGKHSSLKNITRNNVNTFFQGRTKVYKGDNPDADVHTNMAVFESYLPENAYKLQADDSAFWAKTPKVGDTIEIIFKRPTNISRIVVETGFSDDRQRDCLVGARLDAGYKVSRDVNLKGHCTDVRNLGEFIDGRIDVTVTKPSAEIGCLLITVTKTRNKWLFVREIAVFV